MELFNENESDDELPAGWEERVTADGRIYYANHQTRTTQWQHPVTNKEKIISGVLDPRLAFAKSEKNSTNMNHIFNDYTTSSEILKSRDLTGFNAIVTGANRGIGLEITKSLAFVGCYVIMACRNVNEGVKEADLLKKQRPDIKLEVAECDLGDLQSVKQFADKINSRNMTLNMLYLNAAIFEKDHILTKDNIEMMFQVNYLAQFYLTRLLMPCLLVVKFSRIIILGCESHRGADLHKSDISTTHLNISKSDFNGLQQYCNSKLCSILFANEMNRRLHILNYEIICKSCHPGNLDQAAAIPIYLATTNKLNRDCFYWNGFNECESAPEAKDSVLAYRLWEISENILIDRTHMFCDFLAVGDKLSSYTLTENGIRKMSDASSVYN